MAILEALVLACSPMAHNIAVTIMPSKIKYNNYPLHEVAAEAEKRMQAGADIYQKFTCAKCHTRQTIDTKNQFFTKGQCEECGHITDLRLAGCNYLAVFER